MITLPATFMADVGTAVGGNLTTLAPVLVALIGLVVVFWLAKKIIGLFPKAK